MSQSTRDDTLPLRQIRPDHLHDARSSSQQAGLAALIALSSNAQCALTNNDSHLDGSSARIITRLPNGSYETLTNSYNGHSVSTLTWHSFSGFCIAGSSARARSATTGGTGRILLQYVDYRG